MSVTRLKRPLTRRLAATDGEGRPFYLTVHPDGEIEVGPSRLAKKSITIANVYRRSKRKEAKP